MLRSRKVRSSEAAALPFFDAVLFLFFSCSCILFLCNVLGGRLRGPFLYTYTEAMKDLFLFHWEKC